MLCQRWTAAGAAYRFLRELLPASRYPTWTIAVGKRLITVPADSRQAIEYIRKNIKNPAGCSVVTKGLQRTIHIAIETLTDNLCEFPPKPIARVQAGSMVALLWRVVNPLDVSRAAEVAADAINVLGGHDLGVEFPLPGSLRYGTTVKLVEINTSPKRITWPTRFIVDRTEDLRLAAKQGNADAQFHLGCMYYDGHGVPQNYTEAVKWFHLAAEQGNASAQFKFGLMYDTGLGVPQNYAEAVKWYRLAAEQGDADAQNNLGCMYKDGWGVPQNYFKAHMWFNLSATLGNQLALKNRELIARSMTIAQIAEAQKQAAEWRPKSASTSD